MWPQPLFWNHFWTCRQTDEPLRKVRKAAVREWGICHHFLIVDVSWSLPLNLSLNWNLTSWSDTLQEQGCILLISTNLHQTVHVGKTARKFYKQQLINFLSSWQIACCQCCHSVANRRPGSFHLGWTLCHSGNIQSCCASCWESEPLWSISVGRRYKALTPFLHSASRVELKLLLMAWWAGFGKGRALVVVHDSQVGFCSCQ